MTALLAELRPDLKFPLAHGDDADVLVAYSPERVLPGKVLTELINNDRSIGGLSRKSSQRAAALYSTFVAGDLFITQAESAELVKLTENAFRDVNIAFANELAAVCQDLSLNVWEVIDLANRHPRVNILQPGPGVGGHCIAVDPYFIIDAAPNNTRLMSSARRINSDRPLSVVRDIEALLDPTRQADDRLPRPQLQTQHRRHARKPGGRGGEAAVEASQREDHCRRTAMRARCRTTSKAEASSSPIALSAIDQADIVVLLVDHRQFNLIDPEALQDKRLVDTRGLWTWRKARKPDARIEGKKSQAENLALRGGAEQAA